MPVSATRVSGRAVSVQELPLMREIVSRQMRPCTLDGVVIELGHTTGRGRRARDHARQGAVPTTRYVYPLSRHARPPLCEASP